MKKISIAIIAVFIVSSLYLMFGCLVGSRTEINPDTSGSQYASFIYFSTEAGTSRPASQISTFNIQSSMFWGFSAALW